MLTLTMIDRKALSRVIAEFDPVQAWPENVGQAAVALARALGCEHKLEIHDAGGRLFAQAIPPFYTWEFRYHWKSIAAHLLVDRNAESQPQSDGGSPDGA